MPHHIANENTDLRVRDLENVEKVAAELGSGQEPGMKVKQRTVRAVVPREVGLT